MGDEHQPQWTQQILSREYHASALTGSMRLLFRVRQREMLLWLSGKIREARRGQGDVCGSLVSLVARMGTLGAMMRACLRSDPQEGTGTSVRAGYQLSIRA